MGVILDRVAKTATLPASEDDAKKVVYIVTNINDKPELRNSPETYVVNEGEYVRADDLRTVNGLEIEFAAFEINGGTTGLAAEDLLVFGTDGKIVKVASADGYAVCFKVICKTPYMDDGTPDDDERETLKDDLFYVKNDGDNVKLTWISAGLIKTYGVPSDGGKDDIVEDSVATSSAVIADMIGSF